MFHVFYLVKEDHMEWVPATQAIESFIHEHPHSVFIQTCQTEEEAKKLAEDGMQFIIYARNYFEALAKERKNT